MKKLVYGVGINDADYKVTLNKTVNGKSKAVWVCPFYSKWRSMLKRCYSKKYQIISPTYVGCSVIEQWHLLSTFTAWMKTQDWEDKQLDKDLLVNGNKIYSPETCVFVDSKVNSFVLDCGKSRGEFPIGVCWHSTSGLYMVMCSSVETGKRKNLGYFTTPEEAHKAWLTYKLTQAKVLASEQTDQRVAKALIERYENYQQ